MQKGRMLRPPACSVLLVSLLNGHGLFVSFAIIGEPRPAARKRSDGRAFPAAGERADGSASSRGTADDGSGFLLAAVLHYVSMPRHIPALNHVDEDRLLRLSKTANFRGLELGLLAMGFRNAQETSQRQ